MTKHFSSPVFLTSFYVLNSRCLPLVINTTGLSSIFAHQTTLIESALIVQHFSLVWMMAFRPIQNFTKKWQSTRELKNYLALFWRH